ncbi:SigE family RNA polymerase sigma factor [Dactylosporangium fulvum]|uniref:SigE family RNA polymerase sigma factor n=1 Tax=Dactylosporangium fulvum TaxID=53359 RepID=A0ABY5W164_9ACTN|nr:SigE family RNA polymerase sigma factor [Dactylosporangium fulvum]UWP83106.1 SigE family RNA polymerase sigma factor [Dactylosporangium fulvum]
MRPELEREYVEYFELRMPHLRRLAMALCGDFHRADDIVQTVATTLYTGWKKARAAENIDAYVRRAVINTFLSERRLRWARVILTAHLPDRAAVAEQPADERVVVRAALRRLPPRQQAVLVLRFLCDLPVAEVADLLGCAEGTVKSQTSDGLKALRGLLGTGALNLEGVPNRR